MFRISVVSLTPLLTLGLLFPAGNRAFALDPPDPLDVSTEDGLDTGKTTLAPARGGIETIRSGDGAVLTRVDWANQRALARGEAYEAAPGSAYWRAVNRAHNRALENLSSGVLRLARTHHLDLNATAARPALLRARVVDRDLDRISGQITVTVEAPLYGRFGLLANSATALSAFPDLYPEPETPAVHSEPPDQPLPPAIPVRPYIPPAPLGVGLPGTPPGQTGPFTGVVIDCRGLGLLASMSPKIRTNDGHEVWGTVKVSYKFAEEVGIAGFMEDWDRALAYEHRVGPHPLVLRAIGCTGGRARSDAILSDEDAAWLRRENDRTHFLDQFHVMFVVDPLPQ